jgi:hypothetical protein
MHSDDLLAPMPPYSRKRQRESERAIVGVESDKETRTTVGDESGKEEAKEQQSEVKLTKRRMHLKAIKRMNNSRRWSEVNATERKSKKRVQRSRTHLKAKEVKVQQSEMKATKARNHLEVKKRKNNS